MKGVVGAAGFLRRRSSRSCLRLRDAFWAGVSSASDADVIAAGLVGVGFGGDGLSFTIAVGVGVGLGAGVGLAAGNGLDERGAGV